MEDKTTFYAYLTIEDFFDCFAFHSIIRDTDTMIRWSAGHKIWEKGHPGDAMFHLEKLVNLSSAAFAINDSFSERKEVMIPVFENMVPNLLDTDLYCDGAFRSTLWNNMPRPAVRMSATK